MSLFLFTKSFRNSSVYPVLHKQKQSARCGFFRWLPVTVEHENFDEGVSRPLHLATPGGAVVSIFLRKEVCDFKENFFRDWNKCEYNLGMCRNPLLQYLLSHTWIKWTAFSSVHWHCFPYCACGLRNCGKHASLGYVKQLGCDRADFCQTVCSTSGIQWNRCFTVCVFWWNWIEDLFFRSSNCT